MSGENEAVTVPDHSQHRAIDAPLRNRSRIRWTIVYVVGLGLVTAALFLLVPGGGQLAPLVLFGGLMLLMHLPGGAHQHGG